MPTREGIQHFVDTSEPRGVQPGDEWWNIGTGIYYKRVVFRNGSVGWTEIAQPSLILGAANTWVLTQAFSGGITGTTASFSGGITGTTAAFSGSAASDSMIIGSGRSSTGQASLDVKGQIRAPQYIIGNPISGSSITYGAATSNNLLPPPTFHGGTGALTSVGAVATGTNPYYVAVDPTGRFAFLTNYGSNTVQAYTIDQSTGALTAVGSAIGAGSNPYGIAVDPTGRFAFVPNSSSATVQAYTINQSTGALTSVGAVATGTSPYFVAVDPTGRFAFVGNYGGNTIQAYTINQSTGALTSVGTAATGSGPRGIAVDPTGRFAFVANNGSSTVQAYTINQYTGALTSVGTAATGNSPSGVAVEPTGRFAFVTNQGSATVQAYTINQSTGALTSVGTIATGTTPVSVAADPTGRFVIVTNNGSSGTVQAYTINQSTGALTSVGAVAAGTYPTGVAIDPTGRFVFVTSYNNTLQTYRINNFAANSGTFQDGLSIGTTALVPSGSAVSLTLPSSAGTLALTSQITAPSTLLSSANTWAASNTFTSNIINNAPNGTISSTITNVLGGSFALQKLLVKNNILYAFALSYATPCIYDVTNPASPLLLLSAGSGERTYTWSPEAVEIQGDVLYANHNRGSGVVIATYDISNASQFTFLNSITTQPAGDAVAPSTGYSQMKIVGQYLYLFKANTGYIHTYDISNPSAITRVSLVNTGITGTNFGIPVGHSGKFLYFSLSGVNLISVSIENPELPAVVQNYAPGYSYMFGCVIHPNGRYLYQQTSNSSGSPNRIIVHDIKNPTSITTVATVATGGSLTVGGTMFIAGQMMWVQTSDGISTQFSINNPASPASTGVTYATYGIQQIVGQTFYSFTGASTSSSVQIRTNQGIFGSQVDFGSMYAHQVLIGNSGLEVLGSTDIKGGLTIRRSSRFGSNISVNGKITATSTNVSGTATMASANITGQLLVSGKQVLWSGVTGTYPTVSSSASTYSLAIGGDSNPNSFYGLYMGVQGSTGAAWISAQRNDGTAGAYSLLLNPVGGNVGIGTASPAFDLDISKSTVGEVGLRIQNTSAASTSYTAFRMGNDAVGTKFVIFTNSSTRTGDGGVGTTTLRVDNGNLRIATVGTLQFNLPAAPAVGQVLAATDTSGTVGWTTVAGGALSGIVYIGSSSVSTATQALEIGGQRTGNGYAYVDLIGDATYTDFGFRMLRGDTGPNTWSVLDHRGTGDFQLRAVDAAPITFSTTNAERMRITAAGNVGIGTTSPGRLLDVNGTSVHRDTAYFGSTGVQNIAADTTTLYLRATNFAFQNAGATTTQMYLQGNNLGIGTTTPAQKLEIADASNIANSSWAGGTNFIKLVATGNFSEQSIAFQENQSGQDVGAKIGVKNTSYGGYDIIFANRPATSATSTMAERMRIANTGNVGIGTTSPLAKLSVGAGSLTDANLLIQISTQGVATEAYFASNKNGAYGFLVGYDQGNLVTGAVIRQVTADPLYFIVNNNKTAITITSTGNVGIGTASPAAGTLLHVVVVTANDTTGHLQVENTYSGATNGLANASMTVKSRFGTSQFMQWDNAGLRIGSRITTNSGTGAINFTYGNDVVGMVLNSSGNVGIGTSSPGSLGKLVVVGGPIVANGGGTADPEFRLSGASGSVTQNWAMGTDSTQRLYWYDWTASAYRMVITSAGNVGIGTTGPKSTLHVSGSQSVKVSLALATATTLDATHYIITTPATGNIGYTLPDASTATNRVYIIKRLTTGTVTITPATGQYIETGAVNVSFLIPAQYDSYTFVSDGTSKWYIV